MENLKAETVVNVGKGADMIYCWSGRAYIWLFLVFVLLAAGCGQVNPVSPDISGVSGALSTRFDGIGQDTLDAAVGLTARDPKLFDLDDAGQVPIDAMGIDTLDATVWLTAHDLNIRFEGIGLDTLDVNGND